MLSLLFYSACADLVLIIEPLPVLSSCQSQSYTELYEVYKCCVLVVVFLTEVIPGGVKVCCFSRSHLFKKKLPSVPTGSKRVNVQLEVSG